MKLMSDIKICRPTLPAFAGMGIMWGGFSAYVPAIKSTLHADDAMFGFAILFMAIGAVTSMWFAPLFSARLGRFAIAAGGILYVVAMQWIGTVSTLANFAVIGFVAGAAAGLMDVVMNARLSEIEAAHDTSVMNMNHGVFSLAFGFSALFAGLSRQAGHDISTYMFGAGLVVLAMTPLMIQSHVADAVDDDTSNGKLGMAVVWGGLIVLIGFLCENATEGWGALHVERSLGGSAAEGALGPASLGFMMAFGRFGGQALVTRMSEATVLFWAALLSGIGALIAAFAVTPLMAYVGFGCLGLGVSVVAPMVFALVGRRVSNAMRAKAISRVAVIGYFGFFAGPPIMGLLSEWISLTASFAFLAVLLLGIPVLLGRLRRA